MNLTRTFFVSQLCALASSTSLRGNIQRKLGLFDDNNRIIGGSEAIEGRYSYAVALNDKGGHFCGGTLIAPDVVLSAAHCAGGKYNVIIGRHDFRTDDGDDVEIDLELSHPDYDDDTTDNDFMLLFLERSTTEDVEYPIVSPDVVPVSTKVTTLGWGDTDIDDEETAFPDELMHVEVSTISNEECDASKSDADGYDPKDDNYHNQITENMLCAEHQERKDACSGDSGGPLVIRSSSGADSLVGVVSWGISCAHDDFPGVYARVSAQYSWIQQQVCDRSSAPPTYFDCDALKTQQNIAQLSSLSLSTGGWTTLVDEQFTGGMGLFDHHANNANHYLSAEGRSGVVRIQDGNGGSSELTSNLISLQNSSYSRIKVSFSFYAISMEHSDNLCLDYVLDNGSITGERCWSSLHAFQNSQWYNDMSLEFSASNAQSLWIRFRVEGDDNEDDVLLDSVLIQGQA